MNTISVKHNVWLWLTYPIGVLLALASGTGVFVDDFYARETATLKVLTEGADVILLFGFLPTLLVSALLARPAPEGRHGVVFGVDTSAVAMANGVGPMLGASAAAFLGLRAPFLIASAGFAIAALLAWQLIPKPQSSTSPPATS